MQRQDNYLQEHYNQSRSGGVQVPVQEERYTQKPDQYASEPSSTTSAQQRSQPQSHPYSTQQQQIKLEDCIEQTPDSVSDSIYTENRKRYSNEGQEMTSYSHREAVNQSRQPQPLGVYKNQASRPSPQVVQPQQSVISSTQSTQSNLQTTNLFYENAVNKDSEIQLSLEDRQALMKETNNADSLDIISVEEVVSTQEAGSSRNLSQADVSDLSQRPISSDKTHVCMTCYKAFKNKPQLTQHELVHNGIRKHTCSYCEKSFKQLCHLNQHIRTHTGERPYKCTIENCGRSFAQLSNLHHHMKNHEEHVKRDISRQFRCLICDRSYANESSLRTHTLKLHVNVKQLDNSPVVDASAPKKRKKKKAAEPQILAVVDLSSDDDGPPTQVKTELSHGSAHIKAGLNLSTAQIQSALNLGIPSQPSHQVPPSSTSLNPSAASSNQPQNLVMNTLSPNEAITKLLQNRLMGGESLAEAIMRERSSTSQPQQSQAHQSQSFQPPLNAGNQPPNSSTQLVQEMISRQQPLPKVSTLARPVPISLQQQDRAVFSRESYNPERVSQTQNQPQSQEQHREAQGIYM